MAQQDWGAALTERIGRALLELRKARGLSAQQLADRCGELGYPIPRSTIANMETRTRRTVPVQEIAVLARALGVPPVRLLFDVREGTPPVEVLPGLEVLPVEALEWFSGRLRLDDAGAPIDDEDPDRAGGEELRYARQERWSQKASARSAAAIARYRADLEAIEAGLLPDDFGYRANHARAELDKAERWLGTGVDGLRQVREQMRERGMVPPPVRESIREAYEAAGGDV